MNDLRIELDQLEDRKLEYVIARSKVSKDSQALRDAGIPRTTFYSWDAEERDYLNQLAHKIKTEIALKVLLIIQDKAEEAAQVKVGGLKSRKDHIQQSVATEILDRVLGKPTQKQELSSPGNDGLRVLVEYVNGAVTTPDDTSGTSED